MLQASLSLPGSPNHSSYRRSSHSSVSDHQNAFSRVSWTLTAEARLVTANRWFRCSRTSRPRSICLLQSTAPRSLLCRRKVSLFPQCRTPPPVCLVLRRGRPVCPILSMINTRRFGLRWVHFTATRRATRATLLTLPASRTPLIATFTVDLDSLPLTIELVGRGTAKCVPGDDQT